MPVRERPPFLSTTTGRAKEKKPFRMSNLGGKEQEDEEDVFVDAESAEPEPTLRRSARKRKSVSELDTQTPKNTGKRHRPLGKMGGVHRSPDRNKTDNGIPRRQSSTGTVPKPTLTVNTDPPTAAPTPDQLVLLGGMRAVLKEELSETEKRLTGRMAEVESGFGALRDEFRGLEERMNTVEKQLDIRQNHNNTTDELNAHKQDVEPSVTRLARYWKARRSLRLWPVKGDGDDLRVELQRFLSQRLRLGEDVVMDTINCSLRRIPAAPRKKNGIKDEVTVEFPSVELRDVVRGAAYNLAGQKEAGIRLEIAHHLVANFNALSSASFRLKNKHPNCKRNIKYDDENFDLVLDFKTSEDARWRKLRPQQARELLRETGDAAEEVSTADMSEILNGGEAGEDEGDDEDQEEDNPYA